MHLSRRVHQRPARCSARADQQQQAQPPQAQPLAPSRRQLLGAAAAALAASAAPARPAAADGVVDGQGRTFVISEAGEGSFTAAQKQLLEYNLRTQRQNNAPVGFPSFIREGCACSPRCATALRVVLHARPTGAWPTPDGCHWHAAPPPALAHAPAATLHVSTPTHTP